MQTCPSTHLGILRASTILEKGIGQDADWPGVKHSSFTGVPKLPACEPSAISSQCQACQSSTVNPASAAEFRAHYAQVTSRRGCARVAAISISFGPIARPAANRCARMLA
jgi:hypothetical protein